MARRPHRKVKLSRMVGEARPVNDPHVVAIYLVDKHYGGPEEGGWYYTAGERQDDPQFAMLERRFNDAEEAYNYAAKLDREVCGPQNKAEGRRSINSVLSDGEYRAQVFEGTRAPKHFPEHRPHYE